MLGLISMNDDEFIRQITNKAFQLDSDAMRIRELRKIYGVGVALASVILTFYDPTRYGIIDIHSWREVFGKEPQSLFSTSGHYLRWLKCIRNKAEEVELSCRVIEKAFFKKNLDESKA